MYEHVGPKVTSSQDGKTILCLVDDLKVFKITFLHSSQAKGTSSSLKYNFKASVTSGSSIVLFTFFTPNADVLTGKDCTQLVKMYNTLGLRDFPTEILNLKGKKASLPITKGPSAQNESKELARTSNAHRIEYFKQKISSFKTGGNEMISSKAGPTGLLSKEVGSSGMTQMPTTPSQPITGTPSLPGSESGNKQPPKEPERANEPDNKSFKRALFPDEQQD
ncbi:hypothetical protein Tco_0831962 [Tanacetum coccineum]